MAQLPLPDVLCKEIDLDLDKIFNLAVILPGPVELRPQFVSGEIPNLGAVTGDLFRQLNSSLAPLVPIYRLIQIAIAIFDCIQALPDALGPPPDPTKLAKCVAKLSQLIGYVVSIAPQVSVPVLVSSHIDVLVAGLEDLKIQIENLETIQLGIDASVDLVASLNEDVDLQLGAAALQASIDCASANLEVQRDCVVRGACPINALLGILNIFLSLIGQDPIPDLTITVDLDVAIEAIDALIVVLKQLKLVLPDLPSLKSC